MSMTLEKAIKILSELHDQCCQADSIFCTDTTGARCEAVDMAISALRAQDLQPTCNQLATDTISRQAAIDAVNSETVSTNPEHFKSSEKFIKFMDDTDIASFGKWQWANGFNTAVVATKIQLEKLPSAQPEVRPIDYQDCSNAMLKMWMDNVVTDGEYNRIMDKLNAHWAERREK